ncbi:Heat-labile enterotoxin IIA, A chain [Colletotrichum orbiculare MAFF 240422]|uniref:Heat-labile enterotoxin IIA, A chain n=1 Tax=Colletotrichum orbiculare (strain 104-T / ATCC 96160 / CBS 514.97 / LARS 414 / MAFF 240422) TaxID=1213857 RepID=A0A484G0J4_COLOR|nr:Heat-labile enterotoxin IIA, A chain [Colletotrichum orbiculare MAFF 240422]
MLGQHPLALFFFLAASSRSLLCQAAPTGIVYVFRGDVRSPEEIRAAGGFLPKGQTTFDDHQGDRSLYNHAKGIGAKSTDEDAYVSTSASELVTTTFVYFEPIAYIYKIHVTPNMIDTVGTLGKYSFDEEAEFAALGGIKFGQIVSWKHWKSKKLGKKVRNIYYNKGPLSVLWMRNHKSLVKHPPPGSSMTRLAVTRPYDNQMLIDASSAGFHSIAKRCICQPFDEKTTF